MDFVIFTFAIGALIFGSDLIITQSEKIAIKLHIPKSIIGATLVAFGTSFPELLTTITANLNGKPDIAISNIVGGNIFNITLVLSTVLFIFKRKSFNSSFFVKDASWVTIATIIFILMAIDGKISRLDSILLIVGMVSYICFLFKDSSKLINNIEFNGEFHLFKGILLFIIGLFLVVVGADFTVESASAIAHSFNISEWLIGIILISFGTSLPELAISISAVMKGKAEIAIGNIIGSNLANVTIVLGTTGFIRDIPISLQNHIFDIATMFATTVILLIITNSRLYIRPMGVLLLTLLTLFLSKIVV